MIRYDKKLNQEINRTIKNFNQKIARLEKENRQMLPSKITKRQLKENVYTRKELNRKLRELQRFSKRGVEEVITTKGGVNLTIYELERIKRENARIKRNISREITRLRTTTPKIFGKATTSTFSEMGDIDYLNLLARRKALDKNIQKLSREEFERFSKLVERSGRNQEYMNTTFKNNYIDMLLVNAYYINYDENKLEYLKRKLNTLKPNDFLNLFKNDKSIRAILDYYKGISSGELFTYTDVNDDIRLLYDNLIENIDDILKDYA